MKYYYKDDIIEILRCDKTGERFYVKSDREGDEDFLELEDKTTRYVSLDMVFLYKRPFKNWLRHIWKLLIN
jgi:hypothetical protein